MVKLDVNVIVVIGCDGCVGACWGINIFMRNGGGLKIALVI